MRTKQKTSLISSVTIAMLCASLVVQVRPSLGAAGSVIGAVDPLKAAPTKEVRPLGAGDMTVASRTGAFEYSYPITVVPGRLGVQPSLALGYSSQGALRGGVAAGWSLSIPEIKLTFPDGRSAAPAYVSSMSGGHRLVEVNEAPFLDTQNFSEYQDFDSAFRAEYDDSFIRYSIVTGENTSEPVKAVAMTTDGSLHFFGEVAHLERSTSTFDETRWPLTSTVDKFGNRVDYFYREIRVAGGTTPYTQEFVLDRIEYGANARSGIDHFAKVEFGSAQAPTCPSATVPPGASLNHRWKHLRSRGAEKLQTISTFVKDTTASDYRPVRIVELGYDADAERCDGEHGPLRMLTSIQEFAPATSGDPNPGSHLPGAGGAWISRPAVTFDYGPLVREWNEETVRSALPMGGGERPPSESGDYSADPWATLNDMLIDFNGDGVVDRLTAVQPANANDSCGMTVRLGQKGNLAALSNGVQGTPHELPTLPFSSAGPTSAEGCSLAGQHSFYRNYTIHPGCGNVGILYAYRFVDMDADGLPDLIAEISADRRAFWELNESGLATDVETFDPLIPGACPIIAPEVLEGTEECVGRDYCTFDQVAFAQAADAADGIGCGFLYSQRHPQHTPQQPFGVVPCEIPGTCNGDIGPDEDDCPYQGAREPWYHNGAYIWHYWKNEGGTLSTTRQVIRSPIPLNANSGDSSIGHGPLGSSQQHGLFDINGDGFLDAVSVNTPREENGGGPAETPTDPTAWYVWPGDGNGKFADEPIAWHIPYGGRPSRSRSGRYPVQASSDDDRFVYGLDTLQDVNGDGLVDLIKSVNAVEDEILVFLNHGEGFRSGPQNDAAASAYLSTWRYRSALSGETDITRTSYASVNELDAPIAEPFAHVPRARRETRMMIADIDGDGLPDMSSQGSDRAAGTEQVYFGSADGRLLAPQSPGTSNDGVPRREMEAEYADWRIAADFMDIDGDGVVDQVENDSTETLPSQMLVRSTDFQGQPMRLMVGVNNGRGAVSEILYAPHNDDSVASTSQTGAGMPSHSWVVSSVSTQVHHGTTSVATVRYGDPVWNEDNHGRHGFRGFESIETSAKHAPSATTGFSVTKQVYDYDIDWSGRVVETAVFTDGFPAGDGSSLVSSIESSTLVERDQVMDGLTRSFETSRVRSRDCQEADGSFKTYSACSAAQATGETLFWPSYYRADGDSTGPYVASQSFQTWKSATGHYSAFKKLDSILERGTYKVFSTPSFYRLARTAKSVYRGAEGTTGNSIHERVALEHYLPTSDGLYEPVTRQYVDGSVANALLSRKEVDTDLGLVTYEESPNHYGTGIRTNYTYDANTFSVNVATTTTPEPEAGGVGHTTTFETDLGIGQTRRTYSPNIIQCPVGIGLEMSRIEHDGFGRPINEYAHTCTGGVVYGEYRTKHYDYDETTTPGLLIVTETAFLTADESQSSVSKTAFDGLGRVKWISQVLAADEAVTTYTYGTNGQVSTVVAPDPSQNSSAATTTVTYGYDSLERLTSTRIPGGTGLDISYGFDGEFSTKTVSEFVGDGGPSATTLTRTNNFGQLRVVEEETDAANPTVQNGMAVTNYAYDGNGNLSYILDADGIETIMEHDEASRRTAITRGSRTWKYEYDRNGNLVLETSPVPPGAAEADYQTSLAYDNLNRVTSVTNAERDLSAGDLALFGSAATVSTYDTGYNGIGRLASVAGPFRTKSYVYDHAGLVAQEDLAIDVTPHSLQDTLSRQTLYNAAGMPTEVTTPDGQILSYTYDEAGRPKSVIWENSTLGPSYEVASFDRNVAGVVTHQESACIARDWDYDELGRIESTEVYKDPTKDCGAIGTGVGTGGGLLCPGESGFQTLKESMTYYDSSEVETLTVERPCMGSRTFDFGYDVQHQLTTAGESQSGGPYSAVFAFTGAGRVEEAFVSDIMGAPQVIGRNVSYVYGDPTTEPIDGHAVVELTNTDATAFANYSYDYAGNVTERIDAAGPAMDFIYDGADQQRMAVQVGAGDEVYYYDDAGSRYLAVERDGNGAVIRSRVWFGGTEFWYDGAGARTKRMTNISLGASPVARIDSDDLGTEFELSFHNGLGHMMAAVSAEAEMTTGFVYGPFGEVLDESGAVDTHYRRFNGKEADQLSRLNYYGYRYYDPLSLTWTQADPLYRVAPDIAYDQPRHASLYTFSANNPVRFMDPDGRQLRDEGTGCFSMGQCAKESPHAGMSVNWGAVADVVTDFVPGVSQVKAAYKTVKALSKGDFKAAAMEGSGFLPGGKILAKGIKKGGKVVAAWSRKIGSKTRKPIAWLREKVPAAKGSQHPKVKAALEKGRKKHSERKYPSGYEKEVELPSGKRMDAYNKDTKHVIELKPNNPDAIKRGQKQVQEYCDECDKVFGPGHTGTVETYD